ncbi:MAG: ferredoxin family protein [Synergistaceae bacterium]|jgi:adenylylsulfate reductase subunit B|nr:ferredoxin family protein [Synergistaceae bacterium]
MSIEILTEKCTGCGACARVCPGSLIKTGERGVFIERPERCWGCASCLKECPAEAILLYLGADIGGLGGRMSVRREGTRLRWRVEKPDGTARTITTDAKQSNRY